MKDTGVDRTDCKSGRQRSGMGFRCPQIRVARRQPADPCLVVLADASVQNDRYYYSGRWSAVTLLLPHAVLPRMPMSNYFPLCGRI